MGVSSENRIFRLLFTKATKGAVQLFINPVRNKQLGNMAALMGNYTSMLPCILCMNIPTLVNICSLYYNKVCTASAILSLTHMYKILR